MTSGLYDYTRDAAFGEALQADLTCSWTSDELLAFAFNDKSHSPTNFEPGTQYQYSNTKRQRVQSRAGGTDPGTARAQFHSIPAWDKLPPPAVRGCQAYTDRLGDATDGKTVSSHHRGR
jgi:hypothetical protein